MVEKDVPSLTGAVVYEHGIDAVFSVVPGIVSLEEELQTGRENVWSEAQYSYDLAIGK